MQIRDYILLGAILLLALFALRFAWKRRKRGGCGDCSGCSKNCSQRKQ